jgi:5-dehydro-4-deoxyglucarate dehydratase
VPLVRLRDETPGFGVSLIKAGLRLGGLDVGSVRAPLVDPTAEQTERLAAILEGGRRLAAELAP